MPPSVFAELFDQLEAAKTSRGQPSIGAYKGNYPPTGPGPLEESIEETTPPWEYSPFNITRKLAGKALGAGFGALAAGRIGVLPGREHIASDIIKRGLKEPWFHGGGDIDAILGNIHSGPLVKEWQQRAGFDPSRIGQAMGTRLGEPAGVSLTRSPEVARSFGDILRVGVDIPPSSVGQFVDPTFQNLLRESYRKAKPVLGHLPDAITYAERDREAAAFNQAMSDYLRSQGVEAIAYNPKRWGEFELRVLNPKKAVPLGSINARSPVLKRYLEGGPAPVDYGTEALGYQPPSTGLREKLKDWYAQAPKFPSRLRDVLPIGEE